MRVPVYRNLDKPFNILGFNPLELIFLCLVFVISGELAEYFSIQRFWSFLFTFILALSLYLIRKTLGGSFLKKLSNFLRLPSQIMPHLIPARLKGAQKQKESSLGSFWDVNDVDDNGFLYSEDRVAFMFEVKGLDGSFLTSAQATDLHQDWRSILHLLPGEELQIIFRKRVEFSKWVEDQLNQAFLSSNSYGRRILLDRLAEQVSQMSQDEPRLLSQKIIICFWTNELLDKESLVEKRLMIQSQLSSFGFNAKILNKSGIDSELNISAQDLKSSELQEAEWPSLKIEAGHVQINDDQFRALELAQLPESFTELGMIQAITALPYPLDLCVRLTGRDSKPIISNLERKRNLINAQRASNNSPMPALESQLDQIDQVLRSLADYSESIFDMRMTIGLRLPENLALFQRKALANIIRASSQMDFCDFEESTIGSFESYLECIPSFTGKNIRSHTLLGSNAIHFLPFFRPAQGDRRSVVSFQTRNASLYSIDPVDSSLANYNWLVTGTSGSGKSFFVNSLLAQSTSIDPNIFIVDIGGSYNKLTQFLGGRVMSLEAQQGFELSPFFLPKSFDPKEEKLRQQHIYQIFLEMTRLDGQLPAIEVRHLLSESLKEFFERDQIPEHPIAELIEEISKNKSNEAKRLKMLLEPWSVNTFFGQFLDNNKIVTSKDKILTFDLKGLTDFEDLSRVVQLIVCSSLWAMVRRASKKRFSWIVLDEVAFSLLKTQPQFVDELVSTLRKYFAGVVIVVQDLEKVTSSLAASSILQNTQTKAILQQRGNPKNYSDVLSLSKEDQWAIQSLRREKGSYSDIFLIQDVEKTIIRHVPSELEYWLATTAPEDGQKLNNWMDKTKPEKSFQNKVLDFVAKRPSILLILIMTMTITAHFNVFAQVSIPISTQSIQLQQLVNQSEQQIQVLKKVLERADQDTNALEKASQILEKLYTGIDSSIEGFKGSETYEKALLELQSKNNFQNTFADSQRVSEQVSKIYPKESEQNKIDFEDLIQFQKDSVKANKSALNEQKKLQEALLKAQPGFVPKIQAQAQLGSWQASTRVSAQLTELLASIHAMREELRVMNLKNQNSNTLDLLISGSEIQNKKQRGEKKQ